MTTLNVLDAAGILFRATLKSLLYASNVCYCSFLTKPGYTKGQFLHFNCTSLSSSPTKYMSKNCSSFLGAGNKIQTKSPNEDI